MRLTGPRSTSNGSALSCGTELCAGCESRRGASVTGLFDVNILEHMALIQCDCGIFEELSAPRGIYKTRDYGHLMKYRIPI